jgi:pimeloyl-ACP methyl ester carboxylesterase
MKRYAPVWGGFLFYCGLIFLNGLFLLAEPSDKDISSREEIRFDLGQFKIVGDLYIPNPGQKQPAIILVHGDGPARRGPSGEPNRIMSCFLDVGFACFFYDKPGYGESTGDFTRGKLFEERASILLDAVAALKCHPAVNPKQIGLWGISQAGYVMPKAIAKTKDIAFMIAVSCPGIDSVEQSAYLVEKQVLCQGYDETEAKKTGRYYRQRARAKTYAEYLEAAEYLDQNPVTRSMKWGGILSEDRFSPYPPSHQLFFDPVTLLEKIRIPVLAIFGENDTQIDPYQGAEAYKKALTKAGNRSYRVVLFPDANHGILLSQTGCMKDWASNGGYAPGYLELMQEWLKSLSNKWNAQAESQFPESSLRLEEPPLRPGVTGKRINARQ